MTILRRLFLLCVFAWAMLSCVPWGAPALEPNADAAWQFQLSELWGTPAIYGRDVVWTYGPWGFALTRQIHPKTFWLMIAIRAALVAIALFGIHRLLLRKMTNPWWPAVLVFVTVNTLAMTDNTDYLGFLTAATFLLLAIDLVSHACQSNHAGTTGDADDGRLASDCAAKWSLHLLAVALAFFAVAKFTMAPVSAILVVAVSLSALMARCRVMWVIVTYSVSAIALWLAACQPLSALVDYGTNSGEIARSFTEGMSSPMRLSLALLFAGVLAGSWALQAWVMRRQFKQLRGWILIIVFALLLFAVFKAACVRHQGGNCFLFLVACPALVAAGTLMNPARIPRLLAGLLVLAGIATGDLMARERFEVSSVRIFTMRLADPAGVVRSVWSAVSDPDSIRRRHEAALAMLKRQVQPIELVGSVDVFPNDNPVPSLLGWSYRPRPVVQSYQACSIGLNMIDAEFFERPDAPEWVLYRLAPLDGRFPTIDEPLVLDVLLRDYTPVNVVKPSYTLLRRTPGARTMALSPRVRQEVKLGEWITIPPEWSAQRLRCAIAFDHSAAGKAVGFLWQYPQMRLQLKYADGRADDFRLPQELAFMTFHLSPVPRTSVELFGLVDDDWRMTMDSRRVTAMRVVPLHGEADEWAFAPRLRVDVHAYRFASDPASKQIENPPASQPAQPTP